MSAEMFSTTGQSDTFHNGIDRRRPLYLDEGPVPFRSRIPDEGVVENGSKYDCQWAFEKIRNIGTLGGSSPGLNGYVTHDTSRLPTHWDFAEEPRSCVSASIQRETVRDVE
jgi:hypothetical protein